MKVTVITDGKGKLLGAAKGHVAEPDTSKKPGRALKEPRAGLRAGPGQKLHEIDVPDKFERMEDPLEFHKELSAQIKKHQIR